MMSLALLEDSPLVNPTELGPYRRGDYFALPDEPRCELLFGRLYVSPSPSPLHQAVAGLLFRKLADIADQTGGLAFSAPLDITLADHSVAQPDVIYLAPDRRVLLGTTLEGVPDLLVEVLSPGTARRDRVQKLNLYLEAGVREYWLVDPRDRQIEFLVNEGGRFVVALPKGKLYRSAVLPEVELDVVAFWQRVVRMVGESVSG